MLSPIAVVEFQSGNREERPGKFSAATLIRKLLSRRRNIVLSHADASQPGLERMFAALNSLAKRRSWVILLCFSGSAIFLSKAVE